MEGGRGRMRSRGGIGDVVHACAEGRPRSSSASSFRKTVASPDIPATNEAMGFVGRREGIAAMAVASVGVGLVLPHQLSRMPELHVQPS